MPIFPAHPAPTIGEAGAGFTAIFQFRNDVVAAFFLRELRRRNVGDVSVRLPFDALKLDPAEQKTLEARARDAALATSTVAFIGVRFTAWVVKFSQPRVMFDSLGRSPTLRVTWNVSLSAAIASSAPVVDIAGIHRRIAELQSAIASLATAGGHFAEIAALRKLLNMLQDQVRFEQGVLVHEGHWSLTGAVSAGAEARTYSAWAAADLSHKSPTWSSPNQWTALLDAAAPAAAILDGFNSLLRAPVRTVPDVSLSAGMRDGEVLASVQQFNVQQVAIPGNQNDKPVLCLCVTTLANQVGELDRVRSFVGDKSFAYYVSDDVIADLVKLRFSRTDVVKSLNFSAPFNGFRIVDRGDLQMEFMTLDSFSWTPKVTPHGDAFTVSGDFNVKIVAAYDTNGKPRDVNALFHQYKELQSRFDIEIDPFGTMEETDSNPEGAQLVEAITRELLTPVLIPLPIDSRYDSVTGFASQAARAILSRGHLEIPSY